KYRKVVFDEEVDEALREICLEIEKRYELKFLEIGVDKEHIHFLVQLVPMYSVTKLVMLIKSLTARELFKRSDGLKKALWGGELWTNGYFASTAGRDGDMIGKYVKGQGNTRNKEYKKPHCDHRLALF
ncbi:IS200/IS605 family transposase, partial [Fusobacterium nucleatum]